MGLSLGQPLLYAAPPQATPRQRTPPRMLHRWQVQRTNPTYLTRCGTDGCKMSVRCVSEKRKLLSYSYIYLAHILHGSPLIHPGLPKSYTHLLHFPMCIA